MIRPVIILFCHDLSVRNDNTRHTQPIMNDAMPHVRLWLTSEFCQSLHGKNNITKIMSSVKYIGNASGEVQQGGGGV